MDLNEYKQKLIKLREEMPSILKDLAPTVSMSGKAIAERNIKEAGFGAKYSTNEMPAFLFYGKELNQQGSIYAQNAAKDEQGITWGQFRKAQGLQNQFVDLSYSNEMWAGMFPRDPIVDGYKYIAPLGHNNQEGQNKMNYNYKRYGNFIYKALGEKGVNQIADVIQDEFLQIIKSKL